MAPHSSPELDMLPDGSFRQPVRPPIATRLFIWAVLIATVAGALSVAAFALWIALIILPVALGAAAIAWLAFRFQVWRNQASVGRGSRNVWRR